MDLPPSSEATQPAEMFGPRVENTAHLLAWAIQQRMTVKELFERPQHPYTRALLDTLPSMDETRTDRLPSIQGSPPSLTKPLTSCPFAPRCANRLARCSLENPPLITTRPGHDAACWWDPEGGTMRDL